MRTDPGDDPEDDTGDISTADFTRPVLGRLCPEVAAQGPVATGIADSIAMGAAVVERTDITEIVIESPRKASIHRKYVYTILNSQGDEYATVRTFYDKFNDLINATGVLYDADGKVLQKIRKSEMEDWSTAGSGILMTDARVKYYHFSRCCVVILIRSVSKKSGN